MPAVFHHLHRQVDRMAYVANGADASGSELGTLHHAGVELNITFEVQAGTDSRVEKWLVLELAHGGHSRGEGAVADARPAGRERSLDRCLAQRALGHGHRTSTAVDDQSRA